MIIISHRGYWLDKSEKNSPVAFDRSFQKGFGTETDIRDRNGDLVIAHDMATSENMSLDIFFANHPHHDLLLALNIKADGLAQKLKQYLDRNKLNNYFVFDMSVPDTIAYLKAGMNVFSRQSEYEPGVAFYKECKGVWLDAFESIWYNDELIDQHIAAGKKVAIVSAELHGRDHMQHWQKLKHMQSVRTDDVILCTDLPEDAVSFFNTAG